MKPIEPGIRNSFAIETQYRDTAEAFGNLGVPVVGTPALVGFLESAAERCLKPFYEGKEGSLGASIDVVHLAPAPENSTIEARAEVVSVDGRKMRFAVEARLGERLLMKGFHERVVVDLERFLAKLTEDTVAKR
jgi:fluoroacetyl-CoA thioesterase